MICMVVPNSGGTADFVRPEHAKSCSGFLLSCRENKAMSYRNNKAISHKSTRESGERIFVRKRWETADILCVFQGFPNAFLAERIRQNPQAYLRDVADKTRR